MNSTRERRLSRYATGLLVFALHLTLIAALIRTHRPATPPPAAVALLLLPTIRSPSVRIEPAPLRRVRGNSGLAISLPALEASSAPQSPAPAAGAAVTASGNPSGVDWGAEARRALQAFEIRSHQPTNGKSVAGSPGEDTWAPRMAHRAGDEYKTAGGDWIVWINADCYQLATSGPGGNVTGAAPPQTICPAEKE